LARYPDQHVDVAVLCNAGNVNPGRVGREVARVALGRPASAVRTAGPTSSAPAAAPRPPALTPEMLQSYAGKYYSPDIETTLTVTVEGNNLVIHRRPAARMPLRALEQDLFT